MKEKQYNAIVSGVNANTFPQVPVDNGYRDSTHFWYTKFSKPIKAHIPAAKEANLTGVMYAQTEWIRRLIYRRSLQMHVKKPRVSLKSFFKWLYNLGLRK